MNNKGKIICFIFVSVLIFSIYAFCADDQDPFAFSGSSNQVAAPGGNPNAGTGEPPLQDKPGPDTPVAPAMANQEGVEQTMSGTGIEGASAGPETPSAISKNEEMFKEVSVEQKQLSRDQIQKDVDALYKEGKKYYDSEDYEGAAQIWERVIQNYPTAKDLYSIRYALAGAYEYNKEYEKAIDQYQKVLGEKPNFELSNEAAYRVAGCYTKLEKWPYALEIYRDIVRKSPDKKTSIRAYFNMAVIYLKSEKFKKVGNIYNNIIKYYPNSEWEIQARFQLASTYAQTNRYKSAINEYKIIKSKFKDTEWAPRAAMHIGDTYKLSGDLKAAKEAYSKVVYEFYNREDYVQMAEERIKQLKQYKIYEQKYDGTLE
jgi:TolA-binding protein